MVYGIWYVVYQYPKLTSNIIGIVRKGINALLTIIFWSAAVGEAECEMQVNQYLGGFQYKCLRGTFVASQNKAGGGVSAQTK